MGEKPGFLGRQFGCLGSNGCKKGKSCAYCSTSIQWSNHTSSSCRKSWKTAKGKTKRGPLDEANGASTITSAPQPKRRSVLKDVTNISCAKSYENRSTVTKLQSKSKPTQRVERILNKQRCAKKVPKLPPPAVSGSSLVNDSKSAEETQKPVENNTLLICETNFAD
ncbi:hypothetical protein GUJ93_ZPchr0012g20327 [Zizania palustris]|uniref:Uncharacterized protein n=1 Tax=Zizania palustris TaxID=103762 RepID=A0A8J5WQH1_ZIZPA|nr:hypothetical protein GUJ93_ZPchr0012g20327 [Zizania palustris]